MIPRAIQMNLDTYLYNIQNYYESMTKQMTDINIRSKAIKL